jgi:hypothetical protein
MSPNLANQPQAIEAPYNPLIDVPRRMRPRCSAGGRNSWPFDPYVILLFRLISRWAHSITNIGAIIT